MKDQIQQSNEFRLQTRKAIMAIVLFMIVYIVLFLLAIALTAACTWGGISLIISFPRFITLAIGIGLASLGFLVLIFLLKFMFQSHKVDRSHLTEITAGDEPQLFQLIDKIAKEVGTSSPKKVYLSADVNAAVFYDSSLWSMFLPIRKNLQIGLGLVNTVTKEELTAVLAHEFGHFSQRTMKVGSYVYNVNQVIFNMLFENDSYHNMAGKWANVSGYFSIFVALAVKITDVIKWVLRKMYNVVNKSYMALSREMEFQADEIAAHVTGFEPLKSSLLRTDYAVHAYNGVLNFYGEKVELNQKSANVYNEQLYVMNFLAKDNNIEIRDNLPWVELGHLNKFNYSKLVIKDQWSSHPTDEERIKRLEQTGINAKANEAKPANLLFNKIEKWQKLLTDFVFNGVKYSEHPSQLEFKQFKEEYTLNFKRDTFSKIYNGYYDNRNPLIFDPKAEINEPVEVEVKDLFSNNKVILIYAQLALNEDKKVLQQIADKQFKVKSFDYDGKKYQRKQAAFLASKLEKELETVICEIKTNDTNIFRWFAKEEKAQNQQAKLLNLYKQLFFYDKDYDKKIEICNKLSAQLEFVNVTTPFEQIKQNFLAMESDEMIFKGKIKAMMEDERYKVLITGKVKENFDLYLSRMWTYFGAESYFDDNLEVIFSAISNYQYVLSQNFFNLKKELLDYQEVLLLAYCNKTQEVEAEDLVG